MKKKIGILLLVIIISLTLYLIWASVFLSKDDPKITLPSFSLPGVNGNFYTDKQIDLQKPTIISILTNDCNTCNALLESFRKENIDSVNLIIITFDKSLATEISNKINNKKVKVLISTPNYLKTKFGKSNISSVFIYSTKKKLIKHYIGSISPFKYINGYSNKITL